MNTPRSRRALALLVSLVTTIALCVAVAPTAAARASGSSTSTPHAKSTTKVRRTCGPSNDRAKARCFALVRTGVRHHATTPDGYGPGDLQDAYHLPTSSGAGQTVAIVDAFDDPNAEADLAVYRAQYGLPACTTANGCFRKVNQRGAAAPLPSPDAGWAGEIVLDVEMVSAACPRCHILLVEGDDNFNNNLAAAVDTAVGLGAKYVSNSYGSFEDPSQTDLDAFYRHPGVVVTASTGDDGFGASYPATAPGVTAVGGTSLRSATNSRGWTETAWDGAGSGCSDFTAKPAFQHDSGCPNKTVADVSAVADPATGVAVYNTYQAPGWDVYGGTSVSSPLIASVYALGGTPTAGTNPEGYPYAHKTNLYDVTSGSNGGCDPSYLCTAGPGYDGPTGLGTPNGVGAFRAGPRGNVAGVVTNATTGAPVAGAKVSSSTYSTVTDQNGTYTLNLPTGTVSVTAAAYGYAPSTKGGVAVVVNKTVVKNFALAVVPTVPVSGTVLDGSGHHWPLYASISIDGAPGAPVHSSPFTGHYQLSIPRNTTQTVTVTPQYAGYQTKSFTVQIGGAAQNRDLAVPVVSDCSAPGYTTKYTGLVQHFDTTSKPAGWTVKDYAGSGGVWQFDDPAARGNLTGGAGNFAIVDSDFLGPDATQDTALVSPTVNLTNDANPVVGLNSNYRSFFNSIADIDYTVDGGATWKNVYELTDQDQQGPLAVALPGAAHKAAVKVRLRYRGEFSFYWEADDVYVGHRSCAPVPGGLVAGFVKDGNTGAPIVGATVTSTAKPTESGTTADTPNDPAIGDGFYHLFSSTLGSAKFTATKPNYASSTKTVSVPSNYVVRNDYTLAAGRITASPLALTGTATLPGSTRTTLTLNNTGTRPVHVKLAEGNGTFVIADKPTTAAYRGVRGAPVRRVKAHGSPLRSTPRTASGKSLVGPAAAPWESIADYPTAISSNSASYADGKLYSVGGFDGSSDVATLYVYDPETTSWTKGPDMSVTRQAPESAWIDGILYVAGGWDSDGTPIAKTEAYDPGTNAWRTVAANPTPRAAAGVAVLDGKLYLIGGCPTGDSCGASDVEVYDPSSDSWSTSTDYPDLVSWLACGAIDGRVYCAGGTNDTATSKSTYALNGSAWTKLADLPTDEWGGASTPANGQLLVSGGLIENNSVVTNEGWTYDPVADAWSTLPNSNNTVFRGGGTCGFYKVGGFTDPFSPPVASAEVLPGFNDCAKATDVAWLSESSSEFDIAPGASRTITVTMDASVLAQPGTYTATLAVTTDTPYPAIKIPVTFTVKPPRTWGKISGVVVGTSCGGTTAPIAGATVEIDTFAAQYTLTTAADGSYALFLDYRNSPFTVIVAKDGWKPQATRARVTAGGRTVLNFTLKPAKACG